MVKSQQCFDCCDLTNKVHLLQIKENCAWLHVVCKQDNPNIKNIHLELY